MEDFYLVAKKYNGLKEIKGSKHSKVILNMVKSLSRGFRYIKDDETPWCSTFINHIAKESGYERTGSPAAKSWLKVGESVPLKDAQLGNVVVLWRKNKTCGLGHVGIFEAISENGKYVKLYGGNQNNRAGSDWFPVNRVEGVRALKRV